MACEGCDDLRYRFATRGDGTKAIERCDACSLMNDDEAGRVMLVDLYQDVDEWFEGDAQERTATQMLDWGRSCLFHYNSFPLPPAKR